jgi:hypothetical protein
MQAGAWSSWSSARGFRTAVTVRRGERPAPWRIWHATGTKSETSLLKITHGSPETGPDLHWNGSAPSATRTRDLLLRRHNRPSAVQTSEDARHQRAKQLKAVAVRTILLWPGTPVPKAPRAFAADVVCPKLSSPSRASATMASASGLVVACLTPCMGSCSLNRSRLPVQPDGYAHIPGQPDGPEGRGCQGSTRRDSLMTGTGRGSAGRCAVRRGTVPAIMLPLTGLTRRATRWTADEAPHDPLIRSRFTAVHSRRMQKM